MTGCRSVLFFLGLCVLVPNLGALQPAQDWTLVFYVLADNDLEPDALADLAELAESGVDRRAKVVALVDRAKGYDDAALPGIGAFEDARYLELAGGKWIEKKTIGEPDMASPAVFGDFFSWAVRQYPTKHLGLIFWDHGGGWVGYGSDESRPGGDLMKLGDLATRIRQGLAGSKFSKVDLLGFDACLMGNYEVALSLAPVANWLLASSDLEPGHGWDHRAWKELAASGDVQRTARALAEGFLAQGVKNATDAEITLSLVRLEAMQQLEQGLKALVAKLRQVPVPAARIGRVQSAVQGYARSPNQEDDPQLVDLGGLLDSLAALDPALKAPVDQARTALQAAVVSQVRGRARAKTSGLSVYFPVRKNLYSPEYARLPASAWQAFLELYFAANASTAGTTNGAKPAGQATPAPLAAAGTFDFVDDPEALVLESDEDGGQWLKGRLKAGYGDRVVDGLLSFGFKQEDGIVFVGDTVPEVEGDEVAGYWDGTVLVLRQGKQEAYAYLSEDWGDDDTVEFTIPLMYFPRGNLSDEPEDVSLSVVLDGQGTVLSRSFYREQAEVWGEFRPRKGSLVVPTVEIWDPDTEESDWVETMDGGFDPLKEIELDFEDMDFDETPTWMELTVWDAQDHEATIVYEGEPGD